MASSAFLRSLIGVLGCVVATTASPSARASSADVDDASVNAEPSGPLEDDSEVEPVASNVAAKKTDSGAAALGHKGQFHVRLALGAAYRVMMRYDESPTCSTATDDDGNPVKMCGYGAPIMLDSSLGYGVSDSFEPFVWGRFGLKGEGNTQTAPLVVVGAGARFYSMSEQAFKFYVEPSVGLELEGAANNAAGSTYQYKQDLLVRLGLGPQYDFSRNVGAFATAGLSVGMFRAIHTWLDLHLGVQARFP
jgi:hypothetical protein